MSTQLEIAMAGIISGEVRKVADNEGLAPELLRDLVVHGKVVIPKNVNHDIKLSRQFLPSRE